MRYLRGALRRLRVSLATLVGLPGRVWRDWTDFEKTLYSGLLLLGVGLGSVWPPLALIVPGAVISGLAVVATLRSR